MLFWKLPTPGEDESCGFSVGLEAGKIRVRWGHSEGGFSKSVGFSDPRDLLGILGSNLTMP